MPQLSTFCKETLDSLDILINLDIIKEFYFEDEEPTVIFTDHQRISFSNEKEMKIYLEGVMKGCDIFQYLLP